MTWLGFVEQVHVPKNCGRMLFAKDTTCSRNSVVTSGPGNHWGMVDRLPDILEPDATGQKKRKERKSQAERYNPDQQARSRTQNRRKDLRTPCEQLAGNRLFISSRLLRRSRASAKNQHRIFLYLLKARRNVEQASVERGRRERSYRRGHFHQRIRIGTGIRRKSTSRRRGIIVLLLFAKQPAQTFQYRLRFERARRIVGL